MHWTLNEIAEYFKCSCAFVTLLNVTKLCIIRFTPKVQVIAVKHSISLITIWCELLRSSKYNPPVEYYKGLGDYY